jgi:hypothetical protein
MDKIITIVSKKYNLDSIESFSVFNLSNSKYSNEINHWIIKTQNDSYFLKKYPKSYLKRVSNEVNAARRLQKLLLIPKVIPTLKDKKFIIIGDSLYILYQYIHAKNLKDLKTSKAVFLSILCNTQNSLIKLRKEITYYDFKKHIYNNNSLSKKIISKIVPSRSSQQLHDFEYVSFLINESTHNQQDFKKIKSTLVHGDLMLQNILKNKKDFWIIDWEKSKEYITIIDILKSIALVSINPFKKNLGLNKKDFINNSLNCISKIKLPENEIKNAMELFYFHLITNTSTLEKIYIDNQNLVSSITKEDFIICKWVKKNKDEIQIEINNKFKL